MRGLYEAMEVWQAEHLKRLLSLSIQKDGDHYCCIALSNPTEVVICSGSGDSQATVRGGNLDIWNCN
jgi:hypothetical protein